MSTHALSISILPAHLRTLVPEVPGRSYTYTGDDGLVPAGCVLGALPAGHLVFLVDSVGEDEDDGGEIYAGWAVLYFPHLRSDEREREREEAIREAAEQVASSARIGRSGWKDRARAAARLIAAQRYDAWVDATRTDARRTHERAEEADRLAAKAADDAAGVVRLRHGPYGSSYFGSGGAYGTVRTTNAEVAERGDSGFIAGPTVMRVVDRALPATVRASGGDCIGDDGRTWSESYAWDPTTQAWVAA